MTEISITIVAYNDEEDVRVAVRSILGCTAAALSKKLYLVDNSTQKNGLQALEEEYKEVEYLAPGKNLGFGGGHNYVLPKLDSEFHAIVNPDILLTEDSFSALVDFMREQEDIGMAGTCGFPCLLPSVPSGRRPAASPARLPAAGLPSQYPPAPA